MYFQLFSWLRRAHEDLGGVARSILTSTAEVVRHRLNARELQEPTTQLLKLDIENNTASFQLPSMLSFKPAGLQ
jgi:hypothetical protein